MQWRFNLTGTLEAEDLEEAIVKAKAFAKALNVQFTNSDEKLFVSNVDDMEGGDQYIDELGEAEDAFGI